MERTPPSPSFHELAARLRAGDSAPGLGESGTLGHGDGGTPGLAEAALVLAGDLDPGADLAAARAELAQLGAGAAASLRAGDAPDARAAALLTYLHEHCGFRGNQQQYDDPRNSFLPEVLRRRTGIPITLSIVAIEVAAQAGLALEGVSFPGHFLARTAGEPPAVLDAFHGRLLDRAGLTALLRRTLGAEAQLEPAHLAPARPRDVVVRMLSNLKHAHAGRRDWLRALECCDRILLVAPDSAGELRDRGLLYEQLECFGPARDDLERYLALVPNAPEADALRARVDVIRSQAARIS